MIQKKNIPNFLTLLRGFLTVGILFLFLVDPFQTPYFFIYCLFFIANISDALDGYLARKWDCVSNFGKIFDPLFDKILTFSLFFVLVPFSILPLWVYLVFIIRDLLIDGMKNFLLSKGIIVPAIKSAKLKFIFQSLLLHSALLWLSFPDIKIFQIFVFIFAGIGIFFSLLSAGYYFRIFSRQKIFSL